MIEIVRDPEDGVAQSAPVSWAVSRLAATLGASAVAPSAVPASPPLQIVVAGAGSPKAGALLSPLGLAVPAAPESLVVARGGDTIVACGSDVRGLVYAVLDLADRVACSVPAASAASAASLGDALRCDPPVVAQPALAVRSIARLFTSVVEDLAWWHDRSFWDGYLTELATHRFNRFALTLGLGYNFPRGVTDSYLHFAYAFLLDVPGYDVEVTGLPDGERERNLATLRFIGEEVKRRGMHFQLGLWTHAYEWVDSPHANHYVAGLTPETHAAYCRDALGQLLDEVPTVDGLTFRIHGESGIPEGSHDFWRAVFDGAVKASRRLGRPLEIDMHAKGIDDETIAAAAETGLPIVLSPKYIGEHQGLPYHQAAIRELERRSPPRAGHMTVSGGTRRHTRYGYTDLLKEDRAYDILYRIWPGTQRLLLWGDPVLAAGYGRLAGFAGGLGVELCEPLTFKGRMGSGLPGGRNGYADAALVPGGGDPSADWQKYRYTYRVWGRCTYGLDAEPDGRRRWLRHEFGEAAGDAEAALANASRILLLLTTAHGPSANCKTYWPELYTNMPIVSEGGHPYDDTQRPRRFGTASALDPALFSGVDEFAAELLGETPSGRYSPLEVARRLDELARAAEGHLGRARMAIGDHDGSEFQRWAADISIQASVGHFFAHKLRAAVAYALYAGTGDPAALDEALGEYQVARAAWIDAAAHGQVYRHDITFGPQPWQRGHWADRLPAIESDIAAMAAMRAAGTPGGKRAPSLADASETDTAVPAVRVEHTPPAVFAAGRPLRLEVTVVPAAPPGTTAGLRSVQLRYRHANQAESYEATEMRLDEAPAGDGQCARYNATIPGSYTDSPYPLVYFFRLHDARGRAWLSPGLDATLANQPYHLVRQVDRPPAG